ncbi:MAG TPA: hypothetical protein VK207_07605 [Bacteroidales bacterium]|nr:hypothetical protein [Bacteroidales bacterium]
MGKFLIITVFLAAFLIIPSGAQDKPSGMGMTSPGVVAKPSFETVESGINLRVWIMSVVSDATNADSNAVEREKTENDEGKPATHHVMVEVKDAVEGKEIKDANVKLEILSPSGKTDIVDLETMANQYGGNVPLDEKGEYKLSLSVGTEDGRTVKAPFSYKVSK